MTAAIFPAYFLARLVVSRPYAIFAAVGAVAAPALSYSPFLVDEPLAYPAATLAFLLIARAAVRPTRWSIGLGVRVVLPRRASSGRSSRSCSRSSRSSCSPELWRTERRASWRATWSAWRLGRLGVLLGRLRGRSLGRDRPPVVQLVPGDEGS